jgi:hypothetical protein
MMLKIYQKEIDGKLVRKPGHQIVIVKDGLKTINPTEEMILSDGWVEYVKPEPTQEELLIRARNNKKHDIEQYDSSSMVNEFTIQGMPVWLDKATRAGLMLRLQSEEVMGNETTSLWYGTHKFDLPLKDAKGMLYNIEVYASQCYDNTQRHLAELMKLSTIEEIEAYDYRTGYPDKLVF